MHFQTTPTPILGKFICAIIGVIFLGPIGLLLGLFFGHLIDKQIAGLPQNKVHDDRYLDNFFAALGFIAKLDGQVSRQEIDYASNVMRQMRLSASQHELAMKAFYRGKREGFNLEEALSDLAQSCKHQTKLLYFFMNTQVHMAYADGVVKESLKPVLQDIARQLGLRPLNFSYYDAVFGFQQRWQQGYQQYSYQQQQGGFNPGPQQPFAHSMSSAYELLGVTPDSTNEEIKRAYRKLMSKYHPDKLMSKGLSEAEMKQATERVQRIKAAYEAIKAEKNF